MNNLQTTDARSRALNLIEKHIDLNSYLCPTIFLNEFDDLELMIVANTINDHCTRALLKKGLDACDDMCAIDTTEHKILLALDNNEIDEAHEYYHDACKMRSDFDSLCQKHDLRIKAIKTHLLSDHRLPMVGCDTSVIEQNEADAA